MEGLGKYFEQACSDIKTYGKDVSNDDKLKLYGLYKQATIGDCNIQKPGILDLVGRAKWDAWNELKGKSKEDAKKEYVELVLKFIPDNVKANYI